MEKQILKRSSHISYEEVYCSYTYDTLLEDFGRKYEKYVDLGARAIFGSDSHSNIVRFLNRNNDLSFKAGELLIVDGKHQVLKNEIYVPHFSYLNPIFGMYISICGEPPLDIDIILVGGTKKYLKTLIRNMRELELIN